MKTSASLAGIRGTITWSSVLLHPARTAVAAVASVLVARFCRLPESYWAPITTLVITQSSIGTALSVSGERFMGTVLGATVGITVASFGPNLVVFGISVFILGLLSAALHSDRNAYRFAGVTLAIVLLVPSTDSAWRFALHRFADVCIGIGVALVLTVLWPEREEQHH
jgi:uncharacterized membrane protein YgaE (UPF0421/DUF939 family)